MKDHTHLAGASTQKLVPGTAVRTVRDREDTGRVTFACVDTAREFVQMNSSVSGCNMPNLTLADWMRRGASVS